MKTLHKIRWFKMTYLGGDDLTDSRARQVVHQYGVPFVRIGRMMYFDEDRVALWARNRECGSVEPPSDLSTVT